MRDSKFDNVTLPLIEICTDSSHIIGKQDYLTPYH